MTDSNHIHISAKHSLFDLKLGELLDYRDLIYLFTKRSFILTYKQTILGPLWILISPLLTSLAYAFIFGNIAQLSTDGIPQLLFYFSGNALWSYFAACVNNNATTFISNAYLFGKVYFPRLSIPVSNVLSSMIRFLLQMIVVAGLMIYYGMKSMVHFNPLSLVIIPFLLLILGILGMSIGMILSSLTVKYRDLSVVVSFGITLWMYATPVVYPLSTLSSSMKTIILLNPVTEIIEVYRYFLLGTGTIQAAYLIYSMIITIVLFQIGIILFHKVERNFMDIV